MSLPTPSAAASSPASRRSRAGDVPFQWRAFAFRFAAPITAIGLLIVWEAACWLFAIPVFLLPSPSAIVASFSGLSWQVWLGHVWATFSVALSGYLAAIAISVPLGAALASSAVLSRALYPILVVVQSTPVVAVAPIIVVLLGTNDLPRIVITFLIAFFPIVVSTVTGITATPAELVDLSRSLKAAGGRQMMHIRLPYALPYIFSALRVSTTLAVIGAVVAEFVAAERGLGYLIFFSTSFFKVPQAFAALAVLVTLSLVLFRAVGAIQERLFPWSLRR
jgi:NitT/TauT family transport system permease protein